ncbi:hypothetical protein EJB05_20607, partial [Eragrostis curvula]
MRSPDRLHRSLSSLSSAPASPDSSSVSHPLSPQATSWPPTRHIFPFAYDPATAASSDAAAAIPRVLQLFQYSGMYQQQPLQPQQQQPLQRQQMISFDGSSSPQQPQFGSAASPLFPPQLVAPEVQQQMLLRYWSEVLNLSPRGAAASCSSSSSSAPPTPDETRTKQEAPQRQGEEPPNSEAKPLFPEAEQAKSSELQPNPGAQTADQQGGDGNTAVFQPSVTSGGVWGPADEAWFSAWGPGSSVWDYDMDNAHGLFLQSRFAGISSMFGSELGSARISSSLYLHAVAVFRDAWRLEGGDEFYALLCSLHDSNPFVWGSIMAQQPSPMLSVPEKKTAAAVLFRDRHFFNSAFFNEIRDLRAALSAGDSDPPASRRAILLRYHHLLFSARDDPCAFDETLTFTWHDAFKPHLKHSSASLRFEKAALVFNLGAVASNIAAAVDRATAGGVKEACAQFQRAAGAFRAVGEMMEGQGESTVDMSPQAAAMLERLMLAQAQECCFERALAAGTSRAACSKVAMQAGLYYKEAYDALLSPPLHNHFERSWISQIQLKAALFNAEACYRYAMELHEKTEIGEEVARLQVGLNAIEDAKSAKGAPRLLYDSASRLEQDLKQSFEKAVNENHRIYLMRVPAGKSLAPLPAASLVRPASLSEILDTKTESDAQPS